MSGARGGARGRASMVLGAWLGGAMGCVEVPEPLELELDYEDEDVFVAAPAGTDTRSHRSERDYTAWPLSDEPWLAQFERRQVRTYPLWPTPIDEPCPAVMFGSYEPQLDGGPTFERVEARLALVADPRLRVSPTEITLLHDHIDVPGLRLVAASDTRGSCMMGWSHTHCFVSDTTAYCPDGSADELERLVRAHGLGPGSLTRAAWLELAVVMTGTETLVIEPSLVRECTSIEGVEALAPAVELDHGRVTVRFTAITEGHGVDHTVIVEADGDVTMAATERWRMPSDEDVWGGVVAEPAAG